MRFLTAITIGLVLLCGPALLRAEQITVSIANLKYKPAEITVKVGDTVIWVNNDDRDHTVTSEDGPFRSGRLGSGKSYSYTFSKAGRFSYGDDYFARMRGTVTVVEKGK